MTVREDHLAHSMDRASEGRRYGFELQRDQHERINAALSVPALREVSAALASCASSIFAAFAAISTSVQQWRMDSEASRNSLSKELRTFPA